MTSHLSNATRCEECGRYRDELHYSDIAHKVLCLWCYHKLPQAQWRGPEPEPYTSPPRPKPDAYARFHCKVFDRWAAVSRNTVFRIGDGRGRIVGYCPVCHTGTVTVQTLSTLRLALDECSNGCKPEAIAKELLTDDRAIQRK